MKIILEIGSKMKLIYNTHPNMITCLTTLKVQTRHMQQSGGVILQGQNFRTNNNMTQIKNRYNNKLKMT